VAATLEPARLFGIAGFAGDRCGRATSPTWCCSTPIPCRHPQHPPNQYRGGELTPGLMQRLARPSCTRWKPAVPTVRLSSPSVRPSVLTVRPSVLTVRLALQPAPHAAVRISTRHLDARCPPAQPPGRRKPRVRESLPLRGGPILFPAPPPPPQPNGSTGRSRGWIRIASPDASWSPRHCDRLGTISRTGPGIRPIDQLRHPRVLVRPRHGRRRLPPPGSGMRRASCSRLGSPASPS